MKTPRILAFLLLSVLSFAQVNVAPLVPPIVLGPDFAGAKIYTYQAGTSTPLATYQDSVGTILNPNPVILDANGIGRVFVKAQSYKIVLKSALDVTILTLDNLTTLAVLGKPFLSDTLANRPTSCTATVTFFVQTDSPYTVFQCNSTGTGWNSLVPAWVPISTGAAGQQLTMNSAASVAAWQSKPVIDVRDKGAVCDGTTNDYTAIAAAITAVANGGTVRIVGKCAYGTTLSLAASKGVVLEGGSSNAVGYSAPPADKLIYTGSGTSAIDARSSNGFTFRNLGLILKTVGYTGLGIDLSHNGSGIDSSVWSIEDCFISGDDTNTVAGQTDQSAALINADLAIIGSIRNCHLHWAQVGIRGATGTNYSNAIKVDTVTLDNLRVAGIKDPYQGWTLSGVICEGTDGTSSGPTHGMPACILQTLTDISGLSWTGGWVGDKVTSGAWFQLLQCNGCSFVGGSFSNPYGADFSIGNDSYGMMLLGNAMSTGAGFPAIDFNNKAIQGLVVAGNYFLGGAGTAAYVNWSPSTPTQYFIGANRYSGYDATLDRFSTNGQINSTLATGTAPFAVASTTNVANLNASSLNGATFAAPGTIGGGTPAAITGTTVTATGALSGATMTGAMVSASATHAVCWKTATTLGYCSDTVGAGGTCTCN